MCACICVCMGRFLSRFWSIVDVCNEAGDTLIRQSNFVPESVRLFGLGMDSPVDILKVGVIVFVIVLVLVLVILDGDSGGCGVFVCLRMVVIDDMYAVSIHSIIHGT